MPDLEWQYRGRYGMLMLALSSWWLEQWCRYSARWTVPYPRQSAAR